MGSCHRLTGTGKPHFGCAERGRIGKARGDSGALPGHFFIFGIERGQTHLKLLLAARQIGIADFRSGDCGGAPGKLTVYGF